MWLDVYQAQQVKQEQVRDYLRKAETRRLCREAGIDQRGWMTRLACGLLCRLGHWLVTVGRRLERYALPSTASSYPKLHTPRNASLGQ